jgi:hypothetical protein
VELLAQTNFYGNGNGGTTNPTTLDAQAGPLNP